MFQVSDILISLVFQDVVRMLSSLQLAAVEAGVLDQFGGPGRLLSTLL